MGRSAGTGNIKNKWNKKAFEDDKFLSEQEKIEPSETQVNQKKRPHIYQF